MNHPSMSLRIQTYHQGSITVDFTQSIEQQLRKQSINTDELMQKLDVFVTSLERNKERHNINPYIERFNRGIYILGKDASEFGIFPDANLVLKCSEDRWYAENPRAQFFRSVQLTQEFETKLKDKEKALLQICPVYLHFHTRARGARFKRVLWMPRIQGIPLGSTETGLSDEFCHIFDIPKLEEIRHRAKFTLHRLLDRDRHRQLLKIQSAYLFYRLTQRGITIPSLNQKNILRVSTPDGDRVRYVIIDPIADYYLPISPLYNLLTTQFCKLE